MYAIRRKHCQPGLKAFNPAARLLALSLWLAGCVTSGCGGTKDEGIGIGIPLETTAAFAYVEEVIFPEEIRAGEFVKVKFIVSMASNTEMLYTLGPDKLSAALGYQFDDDGQRIGMRMTSSTDGPFTGNAPRTEYEMTTMQFDEGEYTLFILSPDFRENGGIETTIHLTPFFYIEPHPNLIYREFPFTVLPADDAAGE